MTAGSLCTVSFHRNYRRSLWGTRGLGQFVGLVLFVCGATRVEPRARLLTRRLVRVPVSRVEE